MKKFMLGVNMRDFQIFFFKVGNGHCTYIEFPNGENALVDIKVSKNEGDDNLIDILKQARIDNISYLIITHPHQDHIGGLLELIKNCSVENFIYSPIYFRPSPIYDDWIVYEQMRGEGRYCKRKYEVKNTWNTKIGETQIDYLAPVNILLSSQPDNINNNGLLLRISCRGHTIILPGDIETDGWAYIDESNIRNISLLLASHHGNNSGYNLEKLKVMNPAIVVISSGPKTEYDADQKYRRHAMKGVFTTRQKRVIATIDGDNVLRVRNP